VNLGERRPREKKVGTMPLISTTVSKLVPSVADKMAAGRVGDLNYDEPPRNPAGALTRPSEAVGAVGQTNGQEVTAAKALRPTDDVTRSDSVRE
jgi:hypothetical protein